MPVRLVLTPLLISELFLTPLGYNLLVTLKLKRLRWSLGRGILSKKGSLALNLGNLHSFRVRLFFLTIVGPLVGSVL